MKRSLGITAIDEAILSGLSFGIALVFVRAASQHEFGVYTLVIGIVLLLKGVQNALVMTPVTAAGGRLAGPDRDRFVSAAARLQTAAAALAGLLFGAALIVRDPDADGLALGGAAALTVLGGWVRDFERTVRLLDGRNLDALIADAVYAVLVAAGVLAVWAITGTLTSAWALAILGAAGLLPGVATFARRRAAARPARADLRRAARTLLDQGRWTLPGMAVTWAQNSGYAYLVALIMDTATVGLLATARLFVVPLLLLATAWGRVFVPRASGMLARGNAAGVRALSHRATLLLLVPALLWFGSLAVFFPFFGERVLGPRSLVLAPLVAIWAVFATVTVVRSIASNALIAHMAFRRLFAIGTFTSASSLAAVVVLLLWLGPGGAVGGLVVGETLSAAASWWTLEHLR